jgi:hypothetical protein
VPRHYDPLKRRVCSSGCNVMKKTPNLKPKAGSTSESDLFGIVVCQVDRRIICGSKPKGSKKRQGVCKTTKTVSTVAVCSKFLSAIWNAGGSPVTLGLGLRLSSPCRNLHRQPRAPRQDPAMPRDDDQQDGEENDEGNRTSLLLNIYIKSDFFLRLEVCRKGHPKKDASLCKSYGTALAEYY